MPPEEIDGLQLRSPNHSHREHVMNASTNSISRTRESVFTKVCFHYFRFFIFFFKEENEGRGRNSFLSFFVICRILFHWPNFSSSFLEVRTFARAYAFFFVFLRCSFRLNFGLLMPYQTEDVFHRRILTRLVCRPRVVTGPHVRRCES